MPRDDTDIIDVMMQGIITAAMVVTLVQFLPVTRQAQSYMQAQAYTGLPITFELDAAPTLKWVNLVSAPPYTPLISASFHNNGPGSVFIAINNPDELLELVEGDDRDFSMAGAMRRIEFIFYKTSPGMTAKVRVDGKY